MGSSTTTVDDTLAELASEPHYVNVHAEKTGDDVPPGISCADIVLTGMQQQTIMENTAPLPTSGGTSTYALLPAAALILGCGILAFAILRRR